METTPVESENLAAVGYDAQEGTLEIEFKNGRVYEYSRVPSSVYHELMGAVSKGAYFSRNIKDVYRFRRLR